MILIQIKRNGSYRLHLLEFSTLRLEFSRFALDYQLDIAY